MKFDAIVVMRQDEETLRRFITSAMSHSITFEAKDWPEAMRKIEEYYQPDALQAVMIARVSL